MDPESPKPEDSETPESGPKESARSRVDALSSSGSSSEVSSGKDDKSTPKTSNTSDGRARPRLTEKQRLEARKARANQRRRKTAADDPPEGNALSKGMRAVGFEIKRTGAFLGSLVIAALAALGPVFSSAGMGLVWLIEQIGKGLQALLHLGQRALSASGRLVTRLDRIVTPHRALLLVAALGAVLLGVSQYKGLGAIEIGQPGYAGIEDLVRAPAIDRTTPAGVHTQILVPIAAVALLSVTLVALGGVSKYSRRLGRLRRLAAMVLIMVGLLTLVVSLAIDLPDATDTTSAALAYADVKARLLTGFWLQLAAGATLAISGLALLTEPAARQVKRRQTKDRPSRVGESSSLAGKGAINGGSA